jgi:hypothetical protein
LGLSKPPHLCFITGKRREEAISAAVRLREDDDAQRLCALAKASRHANQTPAVADGSRGEAAKMGVKRLSTASRSVFRVIPDIDIWRR